MKGLDLATFIGWLQSLDPDEPVGYACTQSDCPVARFARQELGLLSALVSHNYLYSTDRAVGTRTDISLPLELSWVVRAVDKSGLYKLTAQNVLDTIASLHLPEVAHHG